MDLTAYLCNNSSRRVKTEVVFGDIFDGKKHVFRLIDGKHGTHYRLSHLFGTIK